jgi:hypothetical protein
MLPPLKENYKDIALKAWSMWALYISLGLQAADQLMPYFIDFTSPWYVKAGAFVVTVMAAYVRLMPQKSLPQET